jgi:alkylation response protein AidB-like acyl-CoA dehydrogenase
VAVSALRLGGNAAQQAAWLPGLADGSVMGTLALEEGPHHAPDAIALKATPVDGGWRLDGVKRPVPDGMGASLFIVPARTPQGIALFLLPADTPGLVREPLDQIDARRPALLRLEGVVPGADAMLGAPETGCSPPCSTGPMRARRQNCWGWQRRPSTPRWNISKPACSSAS